MKHLLNPVDLSVEEIDEILDLANDIEAHPEKYAHACEGKNLPHFLPQIAPKKECDIIKKLHYI